MSDKKLNTKRTIPSRVSRRIRKLALAASMAGLCPMLCGQRVALVQHAFYENPPRGAPASGITTGSDGALWMTILGADAIATMTTDGVLKAEYVLAPRSAPLNITSGPDGALWFTENGSNKIGRITMTGAISEYPIPTVASAPRGIVTGPDGALWFTEFQASQIGRITTAGMVMEYSGLTAESGPVEIAAGSDGALWFTEGKGNRIGRITTTGVVTEYPVPTADSSPQGITAGPHGALWFTEIAGNQIGSIATTGAIREYFISTANASPDGIAAGPDGALWFAEQTGAHIGRITPPGDGNEFPIELPYNNSTAITLGPRGDLWFTQIQQNFSYVDAIGQIVFSKAELVVIPQFGQGDTDLTLNGSGYAAGEKVSVYLDGAGYKLIQTVDADSLGKFSGAYHVGTAPYGPLTLVCVGETSGKFGAASYEVTANIVVTPDSIAAGGTVTVQGFGFDAFDPAIEITLDNQVLAQNVATGLGGTFNQEVTIAAGIAPGSYQMAARPAVATGIFGFQEITVK